ncbi:MAG TPA: MFS transporter [Bryobacteraceae bacterium]|nr:MFS transporter [Bryobacteraceae bacterium]
MPDDSKFDRRQAAGALAGFCAFVSLYAPQPLLPLLAAEFHTSVAGISILITISTLGMAAFAPVAGIMADHWGRKAVIVPASLLLAVPSALAATAANVGQLAFWRFFVGVFTPGVSVVIAAYINEEWVQGVGSAMGAYVSGTVIGGFSGRIIMGLVAARFSWRAAFLTLAVLNALGGLGVWIWLPAGRRFVKADSAASTLAAMARHLKNPRLVATYAVGFCVLFSMLATFTYVNFYLAAPPFGLSPAALGFLFVVYLAGAAASPVAGRWVDRKGHRFVLVVAFSGGVVGILLTLFPSLPLIMLGLALCCTGVFTAQAASTSYVGIAAREARAAAVGLYVMFYYIGGSAGAAIPGRFWNRGGWPACVALIAALQILIILLAVLFWQPKRAAAPASLSEIPL